MLSFFTILESLLLKNENASIQESLCKYCPKLITKDIVKRKKTENLIKSMYKIRSAYIHHAKQNVFPEINLLNLQQIVGALILVMLNKSVHFENKKSLLDEIDEAINKAY